MNEMEIYTKTKIVQRGKGSFAVPLPKILMNELGIKLGDLTEVKKNGDTIVLSFPKEGRAPEVAKEATPPEVDPF
jgi:antitoxin component of MazEF toxin-antitoxin module